MEKPTGATLLLQVIVHIPKPRDQHISACYLLLPNKICNTLRCGYIILWVLEKAKVWAVRRIIKPNWSAHKLSFNTHKIFLEALGYESNSSICHIEHKLWNIKCIGKKYSAWFYYFHCFSWNAYTYHAI